MYVLFRQPRQRLQLSLAETRRINGKVVREHVASLGSITMPPTISDRIVFWSGLHQRLAKLSNRITSEDHHKALAAIHIRVPMVKPDEQRQLQRENAEADARFWSGHSDMLKSNAEDQKGLAKTVSRTIAELEAGAADAAVRADTAKERLAKIERGEDVQGGLGKPIDVDEILRSAGWTAADFRHAETISELDKLGAFEEFLAEVKKRNARDRVPRAAARAVLARTSRARSR